MEGQGVVTHQHKVIQEGQTRRGPKKGPRDLLETVQDVPVVVSLKQAMERPQCGPEENEAEQRSKTL
jgi:hypothetical protein